MLLTLPKPAKSEFSFKTHEYSPTFSQSTAARYSPKLNGGPGNSSTMSTNHRGLPPPSAMTSAITLPEPGRSHPSGSQSMGALPPAPSQWQGAEDGMKNWLAAKAEEEKRKQEEEKTRQESLRLEQRKIEQQMLRDSLSSAVPPHLVPMIFAGMGGGSAANMSAELIQQYSAQLQSAQQQQHVQAQAQAQVSPEIRREPRMIGQSQAGAYAGQPQTPQSVLPPAQVLPGQPLPSQPQHGAFSSTSYAGGSMSPRARAAQSSGLVGAPTSAPRGAPQSQLPRLTTNEMQIQQPPGAPTTQQLQQTQQSQREDPSPSIYFHHWVPPSSQQEKSTSGNPPATPSGKYKTSPSYPSRQRAVSHASDPEYTSSPKKRKAQGQHAAPPPPTSAPQSYTSPSFSHVSTSSTSTSGRRGHARGRSDASTRGPEGSSGSLSRRSTVSGHPQTESGAQQQGVHELRFNQPQTPADSHYQSHHEQSYGTQSQRDDGRGNTQRQSRAATPMANQNETRQSGPHQQMEHGSSSPKREVGGQ